MSTTTNNPTTMNTNTNNLERLSAVDTGKALRKALRVAFPCVKFSVRMDRGTAYGCFSIGWVDGPTERDVEEISRQFVGESFDGMTDSTLHVKNTIEWGGKRYRTGARYVHAQRSASAERTAETRAQLLALFPQADETLAHVLARVLPVGAPVDVETVLRYSRYYRIGEQA